MDEIIDDTDYEEVQVPEKKDKPKVEVNSKPAEIVEEEDRGFVPQSKLRQELPT